MCAENTDLGLGRVYTVRNYLRVRGEYTAKRWIVSAPAELPPCARRIPDNMLDTYHRIGTTSVCAENTLPRGGFRPVCRNYLRVRGEYG